MTSRKRESIRVTASCYGISVLRFILYPGRGGLNAEDFDRKDSVPMLGQEDIRKTSSSVHRRIFGAPLAELAELRPGETSRCTVAGASTGESLGAVFAIRSGA